MYICLKPTLFACSMLWWILKQYIFALKTFTIECSGHLDVTSLAHPNHLQLQSKISHMLVTEKLDSTCELFSKILHFQLRIYRDTPSMLDQ